MRAGQGFCGERNNCLIQAVTEFPEDYTQSVINLQSAAPECLQQSQSPMFDLPDGSSRRTFALESGEELEYPGCVRTASLAIHSHYNSLDSLLSRLILQLAGQGGNTDWSSRQEDSRGDFSSQIYKVGTPFSPALLTLLLAGTYPRLHQISVLSQQGERLQVRRTFSHRQGAPPTPDTFQTAPSPSEDQGRLATQHGGSR